MSTAKDKEGLKAQCDNCNWIGDADATKPWFEADRFYERMDVGGEIPAGECPKCGAWAYKMKFDCVEKPACPTCGAENKFLGMRQRALEYTTIDHVVTFKDGKGYVACGDVLETGDCDFVDIDCANCAAHWDKSDQFIADMNAAREKKDES